MENIDISLVYYEEPDHKMNLLFPNKTNFKISIFNYRCTLKQEEEKRRNVYKLYEKTRKELRRRKERYDKEAEMKQQLELTVQALDMELRAVRNNLNQVN